MRCPRFFSLILDSRMAKGMSRLRYLYCEIRSGRGGSGLCWGYVCLAFQPTDSYADTDYSCKKGYHNVEMFIFRPFLAYLTLTPQGEGGKTRGPEAQRLLELAAKKCLDSARKTVDIIYETFRQYSFFRCWYVPPLSPARGIQVWF
jgi:hypothetical protein